MKKSLLSLIACSLLAAGIAGCASEKKAEQPAATAQPPAATPETPTVRAASSAGARVFFVEPQNGATVSNPVTVKFGAEGIEIAKATDGVKDNSGHHHLLIDVEQEPTLDKPLPSDAHVLHYGQGQTETSIELTPGTHTLQLLLAGGNHVPHNPPVRSEKITITVK